MADTKTTADRLARAHTSEAIGLLVEVLRDNTAKRADQIRAAEVLLDRGHGKATQATITIPAKGAAAQRLAQLSTDKLLEMIEARGGMELLAQRNAIDAQFTEAPAALPAPAHPEDSDDVEEISDEAPEDGSDLV